MVRLDSEIYIFQIRATSPTELFWCQQLVTARSANTNNLQMVFKLVLSYLRHKKGFFRLGMERHGAWALLHLMLVR